MRFILATLLAASLVTACQTPCPAPPSGPVTSRLTCEDGSELNVTFSSSPDQVRVEETGYTTLTLAPRISGTGYTYSGGGAELRRRGVETTWTRPGAAVTTCTEHSSDAETTTQRDLPRQAMIVGRPSNNCPGTGLATLSSRTRLSAS